MSADLAPCGRSIDQMIEEAAALYRPAGRFAYFFARSKLRHDPLFATLLHARAIPDAARVVDLGCGQGLLGAWIVVADRDRGRAHLVSPAKNDRDRADPHSSDAHFVDRYRGVDQSANEVARARSALPGARIIEADLHAFDVATLAPCDVITLFDVLHYLEPDAQQRLLCGAHAALCERGTLILRVGDAACASASRRDDAVDLIVCAMRGHPRARLHRRSIAEWVALLQRIGFAVELLDDDCISLKRPRKGSSFANVILRATKALVVPANAGTQCLIDACQKRHGVPASAGTTDPPVKSRVLRIRAAHCKPFASPPIR